MIWFTGMMNAYIGDIFVKEALRALLIVTDNEFVALRLKPGPETELCYCCERRSL